MRRYESIVILDPDLSEEDRDSIFERTGNIISQMDGMLVQLEHWGSRKLAYEIKKRARGYYVRYDYCGLGPLVSEIERTFQIDDRVLKYLTVVLESQVDVDKVNEEIAQLKEKEKERESSQAAQGQEASAESTETTRETTPEKTEGSVPETAEPTATEEESAEGVEEKEGETSTETEIEKEA